MESEIVLDLFCADCDTQAVLRHRLHLATGGSIQACCAMAHFQPKDRICRQRPLTPRCQYLSFLHTPLHQAPQALTPLYFTMRATSTAIALASALGSKALSIKPLLDQSFDSKAEELLNLLNVPGLSVAIVHGNDFESKGYGYARIPSAPATGDTLYYTGSTTKAFVATLAAMMVENKTDFEDVKWSTPLASLLEGDFALSKEYETLHTTLEDALSHRSGLPRHDASYGWSCASTFENIRRMRHLPLTAEPRTRWQYCNTMFGAVGGMIQRHTGASLESVLQEWIWDPLGMTSTGFTNIDEDRIARGYFWQGEHYVPEKYTDLDLVVSVHRLFVIGDDSFFFPL